MSRPARALRDDMTEVLEALNRYLDGCHYGDLEKLRSAVATVSRTPQVDSHEAVAFVRAAGAWYFDATGVSEAECWP